MVMSAREFMETDFFLRAVILIVAGIIIIIVSLYLFFTGGKYSEYSMQLFILGVIAIIIGNWMKKAVK